VILLAWRIPRHIGEPSDLLLTLPLLTIGLTVLVVGLRYVRQYQRPLTTALWVIAIVVLVEGSIAPVLFGLQGNSSRPWPWTHVAIPVLGLSAWAMVVWLSARLARHGLSFALLLCAAYLAYAFTNPGGTAGISNRPALLAVSLAVAAWSNALAAAATIAVLTRRFPALDRDARRRGVLLLLAFPLVNAIIHWLAFTVYPSYDGSGRDRIVVAASFTVPYIVIALVLLGATRLLARRYLPRESLSEQELPTSPP